MWREVTCERRIPEVVERTAGGTDSPNGIVSAQSKGNNSGVQRLRLPPYQRESLGGRVSLRTLRRSPLPRDLTTTRAVPGRPGSPERPPQAKAPLRAAAAALGLGAAAAIAVFIAWAPWAVGFGVAIACAAGWCFWLQGHPD